MGPCSCGRQFLARLSHPRISPRVILGRCPKVADQARWARRQMWVAVGCSHSMCSMDSNEASQLAHRAFDEEGLDRTVLTPRPVGS